jgi:nucleotide-binding universal stress UspA family protein
MISFGTIIVAVDFSQNSRNALRQALRLARLRRVKLHILHVVEPNKLTELVHGHEESERIRAESVSEAERRLQSFVSECGTGDAIMQFHVRHGDVYDELTKLICESKAELLILGSKGTKGNYEGASSLATRCIRKAPTRVMIVRRAHTTPFKRIFALVDLGAHPRQIIERAFVLAQIDGARLEIGHIYLPPWKVMHYMSPTRIPSEEGQARYKEKIVAKLHSLVKPFEKEADGVVVEYHLIESAEKVVGLDEYLEKSEVDLVVLNTRSRRGLGAVFMRTVAEHVIRVSPCSVLAVKPRPFFFM